ncbi:uncharacterized protein N7483_003122 [Penicillium malachiteum]|uniref:uncharacterized protein n=1 Tax=Penicillium malachiteum TaxID=1324776 RepID=UPI002549BA9B|nr:uncharacterized protein N7483_003122 [Penicillium malachiteum]KAJ5728614.1 hypothetical protein N7483_003122 [Penicillium malachiteum]
MLRQAVRGARCYNAARNLSISQRAFSVVTARRLDFGGPNDKVNFYEQDATGKQRHKVDPEAEENAEREEIGQELTKLQEELKVLEKGPFAPDSPFIQSLPEKDRKIALEALRKYEEGKGVEKSHPSLEDVFDEELDEMLKEEFEGMALEQENWQDTAREQRKAAAKKASEARKLAGTDSHPYADRFRKSLRQYNGNVYSGFSGHTPSEAMEAVWQSQNTPQLSKPLRSTHLQSLVQDARSADRALATPQILSYIQALHDGGATNKALEEWEAYQAELSQKKEDLEEYWMLGVHLFAAENNPQRAQDIALAFLANDKSQARVLIPVIVAWGNIPGKEAEVKAWALYLQLKTFLDTNMTMEDYDIISIGLLTAGRLDTAIAIFKDMMVTGRSPANDSTAVYKAALGLAGNLHASSINEKAVNKVSLAALTMLPREFQNRFFYASWMKKLIGMGQVDSAALVIELMYERGVRPDSKHLNGLIAGWLRDGSAKARDKAERLGWAMIQHRINAVWKRYEPVKPVPKIEVQYQEADHSRTPFFLKREVPPASIETFSVLLLHYTRRGDDDMVKYLAKCLSDAHIQPNSYFMNHLLYAELRKQDIHSLWARFRKMSTSVRPDLETYACLWDCAKLQYDRGRTTFDAEFPSARQLFTGMMQWYAQLPPRARNTTNSEFSKELYDQVVRCFCLSKDLAGTLVALQSMKMAFGFAPDNDTARLIVIQVARLAGVPAGTPKHRLRRLASTPRSKENIAQVSRLLEMLGERKSMALQAQGLSLEQLDPHETQQYQLEIMGQLLRIVLSRSERLDPAQVEDELYRAAAEMGFEELNLGSPLGVEDSQLL